MSEDEGTDLMPALLSDTEESDSDNDNDDIFGDDDNVPWTANLNPKLDRISEDLPGCPGIIAEDEESQDLMSAEHQESMQRIFEEISEVMEAQDAERAARSTNPPVRTSTPTERPGQESSTTECGEVGTDDFDSEEDAALLKCVESDNVAESLLEKMERGAKSGFMSSTMIS